MVSGILEVVLIDAAGLGDTDWIGDMDPYVVIKYKYHICESSVARGEGGSPVWNERFKFKVQYPAEVNDQYKLILRIMDKDTFTADDYIGEATIYLKELFELGVEKGIAELHPHKYCVIHSDQSYRGGIRVGITFTPEAKGETDNEEFGGWKNSIDQE